MLTNDQILKLMDEVAAKGLGRLEIERAGFRLRIDGPRPIVNSSFQPSASPAPPPASLGVGPAGQPGSAHAIAASAPGVDVHVVKSPIVGTFYGSPSPDAEPFVRVGDKVVSGQVVCIVEAMKLMNEIECDADGQVVEVYARDAEPVEFGAPLFGVKLANDNQ